MAKLPETRLIVASSTCPDQLYATGFFAPDPFIYVLHRGESFIVLNDLEIDRGRKSARVDHVEAYSEWVEKAGDKAGLTGVLLAFLKHHRIRSVVVPQSFPYSLASELLSNGIKVVPHPQALFWPKREFKSAEELKWIQQAIRITEAGMGRAMEVLAEAEVAPRGKWLQWKGKSLTSDALRVEIDIAIIYAGGEPGDTIVAGGEQACDPHERGNGRLRANELVILDIFPRSKATGYYGDLTRTVVKGEMSDTQRHLWETVLEGQKLALSSMRPGEDGGKIHKAVSAFFTEAGYPTVKKDGRWTGFFHGTGHGLGLELHESPRFGSTRFQLGQVLTVEPGLYIPGLGGVRHEDVACITEKGYRLLSRYPKVPVIS